MELTYADYLSLDELLELQVPRSEPPEHDEILFIVIHQTYELWFKQLLHELDKVEEDMAANHLYGLIHTIKRMRMVMKTLVGQVDILETMTPLSFVSFRDRLETASGFQSFQFRELEFRLGFKREAMVNFHPEGTAGYERVQAAFKRQSLIDHLYRFLELNGANIPEDLIERDVSEANVADERVQEELLRLYKARPDISILLELLTDLDEGLQEWRYRHVKLAERAIGDKQGTGGSLGVEFLKKSLFRPVFPDLWAIRSKM